MVQWGCKNGYSVINIYIYIKAKKIKNLKKSKNDENFGNGF